MRQATAMPFWQDLSGGTKVITCGYLDLLALGGTFSVEMHGRGVTLAPLSALMCQCRGASQADPGDGGILSWRQDIVGGGVRLAHTTYEREFLGAT